MLVVILLYDQLLFRPLVAWADRFRFEQEAGALPPRSWVLDVLRRSRRGRTRSATSSRWCGGARPTAPLPAIGTSRWSTAPDRERPLGRSACGRAVVVAVALVALWQIGRFIVDGVSLAEVGKAVLLGLATLVRVVVLIAIASVDLGADRRRDRHPSAPRRNSSSRWRSSSRRFRRTCCFRSRSRRSSRSASIPTSG